jgi:hypothetical protein
VEGSDVAKHGGVTAAFLSEHGFGAPDSH